MKDSTATISADQANDIARSIRDDASNCYQHGTLNEFMRGMLQGQMIMVKCFMSPEIWIAQGIENEIDFYCRRAQKDEWKRA